MRKVLAQGALAFAALVGLTLFATLCLLAFGIGVGAFAGGVTKTFCLVSGFC